MSQKESEEVKGAESEEAEFIAIEEEDLIKAIHWLIRLRWVSVCTFAVAPPLIYLLTKLTPYIFKTFTTFRGISFPMPVQAKFAIYPLAFYVIAAITSLDNLFFIWLAKRLERIGIFKVGKKRLTRIANFQVIHDLIILTVIVYFTGGMESPALFFFIFHMISASILLPRWASYMNGIIAVFLVATLSNLEFYRILPHKALVLTTPPLNLYTKPDYLVAVVVGFAGMLFGTNFMTSFLVNEIKQKQQELKVKMLELFAFYNTSRMISATLELDKVFNNVMRKIARTFNIEKYSLMLLDKEQKELSIAAHSGLPSDLVDNVRFKAGEGIPGQVLKEGQIISSQDIKDEGDFYKRGILERTEYLSIPLRSRERIIGVLNCHKKEGEEFSEIEKQLLMTIANNLATAITNSELYAEVERLSITDGLTELYNHRYFQDALRKEVERAERYGHNLSLIMVDIDNFKNYNDTHGHPAGDIILKRLAQVIKSATRKIDIVARYGGEEFVLILLETNETGAKDLAERVRRKIEGYPFPNRETQPGGTLSVSLGASTLPIDSQNANELISHADEALYQAKNHGRNKAFLYTEIKK